MTNWETRANVKKYKNRIYKVTSFKMWTILSQIAFALQIIHPNQMYNAFVSKDNAGGMLGLIDTHKLLQ